MSFTEKIYYNSDLYRIIFSYNTCKKCNSFLDINNKIHNKLYDILFLYEQKVYKGCCIKCKKYIIQQNKNHLNKLFNLYSQDF